MRVKTTRPSMMGTQTGCISNAASDQLFDRCPSQTYLITPRTLKGGHNPHRVTPPVVASEGSVLLYDFQRTESIDPVPPTAPDQAQGPACTLQGRHRTGEVARRRMQA